MKSASLWVLASCLSTTYGAVNASEQLGFDHLLLARQGASSPCILSCYDEIFPEFNCPNVTECICYNVPLQDALETCVLENGCSIADAISAEKTQKALCHAPVRNRSMTFIIVETVFLVLAVAVAAMRAVGRGTCFGGAGYGWDDLVLFLCCFPMIGLSVAGYLGALNGLGQDIWELPIPQIERVLMLFYVGNTFYSPVIFGTKIAMVLLYLRIWKESDPVFRRICQVVIALLLGAMISFEFSGIFLCSPVEYAWKAVVGLPGHCVARNAQLYSNAGVNIVADFVVLLLPLRKILVLRLDIQKKIGLLLTFLIGFAVTSASITVLYYLVTQVSNTQNPTWDFFNIAIWRVVEMYLSIICCCVPILAGLFKRSWRKASSVVSERVSGIFEKSWASSSGQRSKNRSTNGASAFAREDLEAANAKSERGPAEWVELKSNGSPERKDDDDEANNLEEGSDPASLVVDNDDLTPAAARELGRARQDDTPSTRTLRRILQLDLSSPESERPGSAPRVQSASQTVHPLRSQGKSIPSDESMNGTRVTDASLKPPADQPFGNASRGPSQTSRKSGPPPLRNLRASTTTRSPPTSPGRENHNGSPKQQDGYPFPNTKHFAAQAQHPRKMRTQTNTSRTPLSPSPSQLESARFKTASYHARSTDLLNEWQWRSSQSDLSNYEGRPLPATPELSASLDQWPQRNV